MKKNAKKNKGITLIALAITIIVLLILAGVTVGSIKGDNSIITKTKKSKEMSIKYGIKENAKIDILEKQKSKGNSNITEDELKQILSKYGTLSTGAANINEETLTTKENYKIPVKDIYEVKVGRLLLDVYDAGELKNGDWVNYTAPQTGKVTITSDESGATTDWEGNDISTGQTFNVDQTTTWRVLGVGIEGGSRHINLIADRPVENSKQLYLNGAKGYINSKNILDKISNIYLNPKYATSARSVKIEDINQVLGAVKTEDANEIKVTAGGNVIYQRTRNEYSYTNQYATPEDFLINKSSNFSKKTENRYSYYHDHYGLKSITNDRIYDLVFSETDNGASYLLASGSVRCFSDCANFYVGFVSLGEASAGGSYLFRSDGYEDMYSDGVRPVISLKSDITENEIFKIEDKRKIVTERINTAE